MPYGLANAPSVFQEYMNEVFREFLHRFGIVYIDDIFMYSRNLADHRHHVSQVLQKLRQFHLYLKLEKCEFHRPTVQFLGYVIREEGIQMDQGKVTAVREWPNPQCVKERQRFIEFANFYCWFIKGFSLFAVSLTTLLRGKPKSPVLELQRPRSPRAIRGGSGRLHHRSRGRAVLAVWWVSTPPGLRLLFKKTDPSETELWHR